MQPPVIVSTRPRELDADVVKFQNNREKWIAFVGLLNGRPYEIFTGLPMMTRVSCYLKTFLKVRSSRAMMRMVISITTSSSRINAVIK